MEEISENTSVLFGLTGGIGSGKSTVAEIFREAGFAVLSADDVASLLMNDNPEVREKLSETFGRNIYNEAGNLNRAMLGEIVFGSTKEQLLNLQKLNSIVHPYVLDELLAQAERLAEQGEQCIILEIPLVYEIGLEDAFDYVIVVLADEQQRINRVKERSKLTEAQIKSRINQQVSSEQVKGYADFVIDNSHSLDKLRQSVQFLVDILPHLPPKSSDDDTSLQPDSEILS